MPVPSQPAARRTSPLPLAGLLLAGLLLLLPGSLRAQDADRADQARERWIFDGELTTVLARGNSESATLGLGTVIRRRWENDALRFEFSALRVETGTVTRRAVGSAGDFSVERTVDTEKTAENFNAKARYDRSLGEHPFVYLAGDWLRNTFAGIESRTLLAVGAGNRWIDSDVSRFSTDLAVTYTFQEDVVEDPDAESSFAGLRAGWDYWRSVSSSAEFQSQLTADLNLQETDDLRFDFTNSLTVDVNEVIALKPSIQLVWRNLPSLAEVPLFTPGGAETGETVRAPLEKLDTFFRLALVLTF